MIPRFVLSRRIEKGAVFRIRSGHTLMGLAQTPSRIATRTLRRSFEAGLEKHQFEGFRRR